MISQFLRRTHTDAHSQVRARVVVYSGFYFLDLLLLPSIMSLTRSRSFSHGHSEDEQNIPVALEWDLHHRNPKSEVILVSSDNVSFRVDAWYLKFQS
jgi:hypothetical protein